jgi:hypothetical protein
MALTCLQIIQTVCKRVGILSPNAALSATDQQIIQLLSICEEEGQAQAKRTTWESLQTEAIFVTVAAETQGTMAAIAPGCKFIINDTIWNRTLRRPVFGPKTPQDWQQLKASQISGPFNSFRIVGDVIKFNPAPAAGQTCAFEYASKNWVVTSTGGTGSVFTNDADTCKLDDDLMVLGTRWRWKQAKGLDYAEDFAEYERQINDAMGRDGGKAVLNLGGGYNDILPVVLVPTGSWGQ